MTMTDHGTSTTVVKLPPGPGLPRAIQGVVAAANHRIALQILRRRYGAAFCRSSGTWLSQRSQSYSSAFQSRPRCR
jgi:hypothetical protein